MDNQPLNSRSHRPEGVGSKIIGMGLRVITLTLHNSHPISIISQRRLCGSLDDLTGGVSWSVYPFTCLSRERTVSVLVCVVWGHPARGLPLFCDSKKGHAQGVYLIYKQIRKVIDLMTKYRYAVFIKGDEKFVIDLWRKRLQDLRRKVFAWCEIVTPYTVKGSDFYDKSLKRCMITLTYDTEGTLVPASEWSPKNISVFMDRLKKKKGLFVFAYAWVVELQARGVPHYHIILIYRGSVPYPDKSGLWRYGMSNIKFRVRTPYYLVTYLKKEAQKNFSLLPSGARAYGVSISDASEYRRMKSLLLPEVIRDRYLQEGDLALEDLVLPSDMRSQFVGNAYTKEYADLLLT